MSWSADEREVREVGSSGETAAVHGKTGDERVITRVTRCYWYVT